MSRSPGRRSEEEDSSMATAAQKRLARAVSSIAKKKDSISEVRKRPRRPERRSKKSRVSIAKRASVSVPWVEVKRRSQSFKSRTKAASLIGKV